METDKISQNINSLKFLYEYELKINDFYHKLTDVSKSNYLPYNYLH